MRILADENIPLVAIEALRRQGHQIIAVVTESPGLKDIEVIDMARKKSAILLTYDRDFGEIVYKNGISNQCGIVLLRIDMESPDTVASYCGWLFNCDLPWYGHFIVATEKRVRVTPLPSARDTSKTPD